MKRSTSHALAALLAGLFVSDASWLKECIESLPEVWKGGYKCLNGSEQSCSYWRSV